MSYSPYTPYRDPLSRNPPSKRDRQIDDALFKFMEKEIKQESKEESIRRSQVLAEVKQLFLDWVKYVAVEVVHLPHDEAMDVGGELFVSGSHKLNVREPGADIDTICVAPNFCLREHFFTSLKDRLLAHPDVTNLTSVESAKVPLITFDFRNVNIDFLFARMAENSIPKDINERIFEDEILRNLDEASVMSVNGPRATYMISKLVPNYDNFLIVLRCIRVWAKRRGLYGNKFGFLGGINCNILVAFVCQLYPEASPSNLLQRFFRVYSNWDWPSPIQLNHIKPNMSGDDFRIWSKDYDYNDLMPMITPAYPAMNSAKSVSENSLRVMTEEFNKGNEIMTKIIAEGGEGWDRLFLPTSFFVDYECYLACHIISSADVREERSREWKGLLQSVLRFLPDYLQQLPVKSIHLFPREFPSDKSDTVNSCCYYIGFNIERSFMHNNEFNIFQCEQEFWDKRLSYFKSDPDDPEDCFDFMVEPLKFKTLPDEVFDSLGGRACAKMVRDLKKESRRSKKHTGQSSTGVALDSTSTPSKHSTELTEVVRESNTTTPAPQLTPQLSTSSAKEILSNTLATLLSSGPGVKASSSGVSSNQKVSLKRKIFEDGNDQDNFDDIRKIKSRYIRDIVRGDTNFNERSVAMLMPTECGIGEMNFQPVPNIVWDFTK